MSASFILTFTPSWTFLAELHRCVEILSRGLFHWLHGGRSETGLIEFRPRETSPRAAASAVKISRSHFNARANSADLKTRACQNKTASNQIGPMAELRSLRVASGRQVQSSSGPPGGSAPQTPTVIITPPPPHPPLPLPAPAWTTQWPQCSEWTALKLVPTLETALN